METLADKAKNLHDWVDELTIEEYENVQLLRLEDAHREEKEHVEEVADLVWKMAILQHNVNEYKKMLDAIREHLDKYPRCGSCNLWNEEEERCEQAWGLYCPKDEWLGGLRCR